MSEQDFYETLGVARNASDAEVKKAYRRMAMKYHPDRHAGDKQTEEKFKEVNAAYEVLSNAQKRAAYDKFGHAGLGGAAGGQQGGPQGFGGFSDVFEDLFGNVFGEGGPGGAQARRGSDLGYELELTMEQAVHGTKMDIQVPTFVVCKECSGSGAKKGTSPTTCSACDGEGQVRMQQGFFSIQQPCPSCRGQGQMITDPCTSCHGQGRKQERKKLSVKIPAGVDNGDRIRLAGEGEAGLHGAQSGDLYVQIRVKKHALFQRDGNSLYCEVPVSFVTAAMGGEIEIPTLEKPVKLKIPSETQSGKVFRLRGKGVKSLRGYGMGDLFCTVTVETPVNLTKEQQALLNKLNDSLKAGGKKHHPKENSWFAGVKKFFEEL